MSCKCSNSCNLCPHMVKSTDISVSNKRVEITIPEVTISNMEPLCVVLAQRIPSNVTADMPVRIITESFTLKLVTPRANKVYGDQLLARRVLRTRVATDLKLAVLTNPACIRNTNHEFPVLSDAITCQPMSLADEPSEKSAAKDGDDK